MTARPSPWGRAFDVSSAELADLRQTWADAGRQVWDAATRAGRDIQARTRQELELLGRNYLSQAKEERAAAQAAGHAINSLSRSGADVVRRGAASVGSQARAAARAQTDVALTQQAQQVRAADSAVRFVTMPPAPFLRQGTPTDPGPGRLYDEFRNGEGPENRVLGPRSSFSREFADAPSVRAFVRESLGNWNRQNGGEDMYRNPRRADFGAGDFVTDAAAANGAAHVIGTFGLAGERRGDTVDWWAENDMGRRSYYGGRLLRKAGFEGIPDLPRPGPQGTTHQTILFRTDLHGKPMR